MRWRRCWWRRPSWGMVQGGGLSDCCAVATREVATARGEGKERPRRRCHGRAARQSQQVEGAHQRSARPSSPSRWKQMRPERASARYLSQWSSPHSNVGASKVETTKKNANPGMTFLIIISKTTWFSSLVVKMTRFDQFCVCVPWQLVCAPFKWKNHG